MNYSRLTDFEKWSLFKEGDEHALSLIYSEYSQVLYLYGLKFTNDHLSVEDCIQDLFAELLKNCGNLGDTDNILFYLLKSFKRKLMRNLQKKKNTGSIRGNYDFNISYSIEHEIISDEVSKQRSEQLTRALKELTPRQKEAIYLKFTKELDYKEVSGVMDISVEACRNLIAKAIKILREAVRENGGIGMDF